MPRGKKFTAEQIIGTLARIEVDPQTFAVKVDGTHATAPPAKKLSLNQLYFFS